MNDRMYPMGLEPMAQWIRGELAARDSVFGIGRALFFTPSPSDPFRTRAFGHPLDTPLGVAAGPHTQLAQNIVAAWLCGARFIELKTVQVLDQLTVSKPCIDMEDAGYNVEWSQELRIPESVAEYVHAWLLVHALHRALGFPGDSPGVVFNMSVGYNLEGIRSAGVQQFLAAMHDAGPHLAAARAALGRAWPELSDVAPPVRISDNVTLSTMHGCPPGEIGAICRYMLEEQGLHTYVKLNPTLLGPDRLRPLLNDQLGFRDIHVPDEAFGHDIAFDDAVALIRGLRSVAADRGLRFGVKLSNTLEVVNHRRVFDPKEKQMYLSGRPLHAVTVQVAKRLQDAFDGALDISFAGGADAFNVADLLACGMQTVTVCSDLLRSGGYTRLAQYLTNLRNACTAQGAGTLDDLIAARAENASAGRAAAARINLDRYAAHVADDPAYHAATFHRSDTKSMRPLGRFDCIQAPCTEVCPVEQRVPQYMRMVKAGRIDDAARVVVRDNTMPAILGRACHHPCHTRCVRTHLDQPVEIREIKRFIMDHARVHRLPAFLRSERIAIVGAGPCGLAAADFLTRAGYPVTLIDAQPRAGGMVASSIPGYRASNEALDRDVSFLVERGVELRLGRTAGIDFSLDDLRAEGFAVVVIAIGAQQAGTLDTGGVPVKGLSDSLTFLRACRTGQPPAVGRRVGVIGGGDVAMDCARTAWRLGAEEVSVIYRRTRAEMPAQYEELHGLLDEHIPVRELRAPVEVLHADGRLTGLRCAVMELGEPDASGRRRPQPVPGRFEEIPLDHAIVAINQSGAFGWLDAAGIERNAHGYLAVDPDTLQTSLPGVYAGGDAVGEGPATIVKALGDGKRIARAIRRRFEGALAPEPEVRDLPEPDRFELQLRRAKRTAPVPPPERPPETRRDFEEVTATMDPASARREAERCLDCDLLCSYCVGVCPNLALFTYETTPLAVSVPAGRIDQGQWHPLEENRIDIRQRYQVAVLSDFCNECGNCTTFCPSAGRPYRDKPRLYRTVEKFNAAGDNAFLIQRTEQGLVVFARHRGETHRLHVNGRIVYETPSLTATWTTGWRLESVHAKPGAADRPQISLVPAVEMAALARGVTESMPFLPDAGETPA